MRGISLRARGRRGRSAPAQQVSFFCPDRSALGKALVRVALSYESFALGGVLLRPIGEPFERHLRAGVGAVPPCLRRLSGGGRREGRGRCESRERRYKEDDTHGSTLVRVEPGVTSPSPVVRVRGANGRIGPERVFSPSGRPAAPMPGGPCPIRIEARSRAGAAAAAPSRWCRRPAGSRSRACRRAAPRTPWRGAGPARFR